MASVTIDLGSGRRATLTRGGRSAGVGLPTAQRNAVSELMLHWPKYTGLTANALTYLRQLGLTVLRGSPIDTLKSAIEDGSVAVAIETTRRTGGISGGQPSTAPFPRANRVARAALATSPSLFVDKPTPSWAQPSDVTANELISYLESVVAGAGGGVVPSSTTALADDANVSTPLADSGPFTYGEDAPNGDVVEIAGRVSEEMEGECHAQYELDMEMCAVKSAMLGGSPAAYSECARQAFANYQTCRGY